MKVRLMCLSVTAVLLATGCDLFGGSGNGEKAVDVVPDPGREAEEVFIEEVAPCVPECQEKACGHDGCGGSCGLCESGSCAHYACVETPPVCMDVTGLYRLEVFCHGSKETEMEIELWQDGSVVGGEAGLLHGTIDAECLMSLDTDMWRELMIKDCKGLVEDLSVEFPLPCAGECTMVLNQLADF